MSSSSNIEILAKSLKIEGKNSSSGIWLHYNQGIQGLEYNHVNKDSSYVGELQKTPITPDIIFVGQNYPSLTFAMDFLPGTNTSVTSERKGLLPLTISKNNLNVSYTPMETTDMFTFSLYSTDNSSARTILKAMTIDTIDVIPTYIEGNPTINTLNNLYTGLTMNFFENVDAGTVTTFSSESSVSNVTFSNGKCSFDYRTPTTHTSDKIIFTNLRNQRIQVVNKAPQIFELTNLKLQPSFSSWLLSPGSQNFSYINSDSLIAIFTKDIQTCTSITSSSGLPTIIIPNSIIGNQVKFEWSSLNTGNVTFTFNGLTSVDGTIDANVDGLTVAGPVILNTPATIIGWNGVQPNEPNTLYNVSVTFSKQLSASRIPVITSSDTSNPVFTSISGSEVNFTLTTSSNPDYTVYTFNNVIALDGSIKNGATISAGAKIVSVQVETDLAGSYVTMSKLVKLRSQKVKIFLSKPIIGTLSLASNSNCTFGVVTMITGLIAEFRVTPFDNSLFLTIQSDNIICQDSSQSTISHTFDLVYSQTVLNLFETSNKNSSKTTFDVGTDVALSLEVSKEILDLSSTTITCSNGIISNITFSSELGRYYYNFNLLPTLPGTNETIYVNKAKDLNGFKYDIFKSSLNFANVYPKAISYFGNGLSAFSLRKDVFKMVTITLSGVTNQTPTAYVYYSYTSDSLSPTLLGTYSFSETGTISFPFTPTVLGTIYFYIKGITIIGFIQPAFLVSPGVSVLWFAPSSASLVCSLNGATSGGDYNVMGLASGKTYSDALISLQWDDNISNPLNIAEIGAVQLYIGGSVVPNGISSYTYSSITNNILIGSINPGSRVGIMYISVTLTSPAGTTIDIETTGHAVYAVPDTVSIATISDGYSLINSKETQTTFFFSHTNNSINSLMTILDTGLPANIVSVTSTSTIELDTSITIPRNIGAKVTSTNNQQTFTFMFLSTRTTVQVIVPVSNIYTFPESSTFTLISDGISKGSVVTLNKISTLTWTFPNSLPSSVIHTITATGATISSSIASPLSSSRLSLVYKLTPTIKQNIDPTVSVTFGGVTVTYTNTVLLAENIYKLPSGLSAVVSFVGSSTSALDSYISTLAIGASYGSEAGNTLCGPGNTSSILLTLTDFDSITGNTNEITKVTCVNSSTLVAVGIDPTYTYTSNSHSASIKLYTVPTNLTSSVKFSVIVTAPDGYTTTLNSSETFFTELGATTASLGSVATGITLVSGSNVNLPVTFSNSGGVLTPSTLISTNGTFSAISNSVTSGSFSATYTGEAISTDIIFTVAPTQRRIIVSVPASAILVWPTSASTAPVNNVTIGIASAMKTTLSSSVQNAVTASFGSLTASDASTGSSLSAPSVSGTFVTYTITPTSNATYTSSITLSVSTYSITYNQTIVNADQVYAWPTGVDAVLSLNGATSGSDYNILGFAAGRTYSSSVTLSLKGIDPSPVNTLEVVASGAIRVYVSGTLVPNVVTSYTYNSITHEVVVNSMTLGIQTGALQFGVTVTAPSGSTYQLLSSGHTVYAVPDTVTIGTIGSGYSLIDSNPIATTFTFSHSNSTLNNSLGTLATGASSSTISVVSTATVTLSSTFGTSKVLNATVTASASQQTFTFMFASTRTTAVSTVLVGAIYSFPTSVTFSQPPFAIGSSVIVTATTNTTLVSGMTWAISASLGTIGSGSGTTLSASSQLSFTYTALSKSDASGTLTLTWASVSCVLSSTLATVSGIYTSPTTLTYDGASLNPTFYSRHFKHATLGSVNLTINGELILGSPQAITNAVSSVTYTQLQPAVVSSIYATNASGTTKTGGYNTDAFASTLLVAFPGDSLSDVSHLINTSTTAKTVTTKSGTSVITTTSKFYGSSVSTFTSGLTGAIRFGDFPTNILASNANITVEMWVNVFNTLRGYSPLFVSRPLTTNTITLGIVWSGSQPNGYSPGALQLRTWANTTYTGSYNVTSNAWHHVAMTKSGTTYKVYLNGTVAITATITDSIPGGTQFILGGFRAPAFGDASDDADDANAYFNDLRVYSSVKYTSNFSADSSPITTTTTASLAGSTFTSSSFTVQMTPTVYQPMTITAVLNMPSSTTKTLTVSVPLSDFYTYIYPTSITSISPISEIYTGDSTLMTFNLSPVDGAPNATAVIYQASTSSSTTPTQVSTANGTATGAGVLTASCTFPTAGTWYLYALISSPSGTAATTRIVCSTPITVSTYVMPTTMTYDGATLNQSTFGTGFGFKQSVASDVVLTFARLYMGNPPLISNAYSSITYTQSSSAVFPPIYITSSTGAKIGGVNSDPFASWLVLAIPGNALSDVSNSINSSSTTKGVYAFGSVITTITQSKFYGSSIYIPGWVASANTGIKVTGMPTGFLYGDWTAEGWFYLTTLSRATLFKLGLCTDPASVSNTTTNPTVRILIENTTTSWLEITAGAYYQATFSSSVFAINQWFHVALVRSSSPGNKGIFTVFVNGTARTLTQNIATGTRPVGDPGTIMFVGTNDDTNTNSCNINGYVQDVRFYVTSKYKTNFSVSALPISKTATLVSSTSTSLRLSITPDYYDTITFSAALKGPSSTTSILTTTTSLTDIVPAPVSVQSSTVSARYLRLTLFYAGGTGTSGPSFPKLGVYTQSADAYEDTGISLLNIARSATFTSVSGDSTAATTTSMLACINDTRTSWSTSTSGTTFGTTKTTGPAYYTIDLGSTQTIAALKFAEVLYESTGSEWFSTRLEISSDNSTWELAHLINPYGNETQTYLHSGYSLTSVTYPATVTSIYTTNATGITKTGGYNVDSYASSLIVALPFDSLSEVSNSINPASTTKTVTPKVNTRILTTTSAKFYGKVSYPSAAGTSSCVVSGLPTSYFGNNFTLEAWIMITGGGTGNLFGSDPLGYGFSIQCSGAGELYLSLNSGGVYRGIFAAYGGQSTLPVGSWFHFAFTRSGGSTYKIYVNGTVVMTKVDSTAVTGYNTTLTVGGIRQDGSYSDDFTGYMQDVRVYTTCKYSENFSVNPVTSLIGESLVLAVVSREYKSTSYSFPTSLGVATGTLTEGTFGKLSIVASTTQGATAVVAHSSAAPDANGVFTLWESQVTVSTPVIGAGTFDSGTLTSIVKPILSGQVYFYVKPTAPGGGSTSSSYVVVGPVTVTPYPLPTSISAASISALSVSTAVSGQTLTLSGPNIANLVATNVVVYLNTSSTVISNCTVTAYNSATGVVTFTATPTVSGMNTLYAKLTSPFGGTTTTLSFLGTTGQGVYVDSAPVPIITSSAGAIATRTFNGSTYICIRAGGTLTIPTAITGAEILMIAGGGGGGFTGVGGGGAGGTAYISGASIPAGNYAVTVGAGGAGGVSDGALGTTGSNTVAFGVTVYGGGGGGHGGNALAGGCGGGAGYNTGSGGTVTAATGSLSGITGTLVTYGNAGGANSIAASAPHYPGAGGGGIGGVGGLATASPMRSGAGGVGKSTWSDWCAACGVGEGDTSGIFWIGGGGGAALNEVSNVRAAGAGGKGGGGRGGWGYTITSNGIDGIGTSGLDYSGGGGGSGHIVLSGTGGTNDYGNGPAGAGGSGVIIIKQATAGGYMTITSPTSVAGLQVWLDGSDPSNGVVPADGTAITTWVDKVTGNLHSAVPVNTANKAIFKGAGTVGGIKTTVGTMLFKNTPYRIPYTSFSPTYTIFSVFRAETGLTTAGLSMMPVLTNNSCYVLTGAADYQLYFGMYQDKYATAVGASGAWYGMAANTPSTTVRGQWVLATMQYSASTKTTTTFLNGIAMTSKGPNAAAQNGGIAWNDLYIGQNNSAGADYRLHGYIGEILIYNSVLSTTDRQSVESYLSLKYGFGVDCSGTSGAYTMPTSFTVPSTSYLTATTITTTGASTSPAPIVVYYAATAGIISVAGLIQAGTGTLTSNLASILTTIPVGTWYVYIRVTSPSGVVGPFLGAPETTTVSLYTLPTSVAVGTCVLQSSVASGTCTLVLSGPNTANLVASKITVTVGSVAATVSSYTAGTATISFTVTPTTVGTTTITVVITAPPTGVTTNTTLTTTTVVQGPAASVAVTSGTLVYNTAQTLGLTFRDSASNVSYLAGTLNTDAVAYAKVTHASSPFWITDSTGEKRTTTSPLAWQDELGTSLVLALPLDAGTTIDQRSVAGGLAGQATVIATGTASWLGPTPAVKFYGSSTSFSGSAYLSVSALPATLGSSDFTVELWANATTISGCLFATPSIKLELLGTTAYVWINNGTWVSQITASVSVSAVTWTHYAVVRYGKTTTLYINGVSRGTTTETITNSSTTMTIGQYFTGYLTDVRVYVTAKYMSTFSIWTITLDTVTSGISLLLDAGKTTSYPGTGTTWTDLSGNGYNGTLTNGPTYSSNNSGYILFDGSNDYVTGSIATSVFSGAHTISCWFYRSSITQDGSALFSNNTTNNQCSAFIFLQGTNNIGLMQVGVTWTAAVSLDLGADHLNKWIYATIVYSGVTNGSAVKVYAYKNGTLLTASGALFWNLATSASYVIGRHYSGGIYFTGYIPHVAVYNRGLSAAEIAQNYNALKVRYGFTADTSASTLVDIPVSSIVRTGTVLSVPITATSYRSARLFLSIKGAGTGGTNLELATIARPTQYVSPTSFTYSTTGTINVTVLTSVSITMTGADTVAGTVAVYASTSQTDLEPIIVCASAPLSTTGLATAPCTFSTAGTLYISIRAISPEGVLGSLVVSSVPLTVVAYSLPTNVSQTSLLETTTLSAGTSTGSQTTMITGSNTSNVAASNIAVFMNTSSTQVSNGTVTNYNSSTGLVTFTVTPTVVGMNTLYVKITAPVVGSTQSTTLAFTGTTGQGYFVDAAIPFPPLKLPAAGSVTQSGTSSVILSDGSWSYVGGYLGVIVGRVFTGDFTLVVSWTTIDNSAAYFYVTAAMVSKTVASTSDFIWNNQETWTPSTYSSDFPGYSLLFSWYNSSYGGGSNRFIANWYKTFYRYQRIGNAVSLDFGASATGPWTSIVTGTTTTGSQVLCFIGTCSAETSQKTAKIESLVTATETFGSSNYTMPTSFTFSPITGYVDGSSSNMTITTLGGSTVSSPITVYYSSSATATSITGLTQAGTGTLTSRTSTVSVAIPGGNWYVYIRVTSPNAAVGPVILSSFTITSATATFYYPFASDIKNYTSGVGVSDAVMGVAGNLSGGTATFSEKSLVLTGSSTHNAAGASYVVLPSTSSGNTAAFSCWFKSNNNGNFTRIIDMATNGSFRLYITGSNTLNFNDVYTISTTTNVNNNTWVFIAINSTGNNFSWVINAGDAGNSGSGSISAKPVNFTGSVGYLGHSFGGDPEFAGSLKEVRFFANANLTSEQISTMYAGTTLLTSRQYTQATSIVSFTPAIPVQSATTTFAVTLGGYENVVNGTSSVYYSATDSDTNPTLIGTATLLSGVVTVSGLVPLNTFYLYARSISPTSVQGSLLVSSLVTPRVYSFPTSVTFTSIQVNANTQLTFAPADGLASASVIIYYHSSNTSTNPTQCGTGTISSSGIANITCTFPSGSAVYVYARVTSPDGVQGSLLCSSITGIASPVVTITSSSGEIATRTFNGATYTCIRSSGTLTVYQPITGAEIFIIAGGGGGSFSAGAGGGAGGAAYISNANIPVGTYAVTVGAGGAGAANDGGVGSAGGNSVGFGVTVYGGGGGSHNSTGYSGGCGGGGGYGLNSAGGSVTVSTGSLSGITGTLVRYGNAGGNNPTNSGGSPSSYATGGGGGIGSVGGSATTTPTGGAGGVGKSTWSDWCAACGVGEGDTSGVFWIGGGGGGTCNEMSGGVRKAGDGGKGGGGKGGFATSMTTLGFDGCATGGLDYSGGGGGGGHITLPASLSGGYVPPGGRGGSGVIIIKQATSGSYTTINAPTDIAGLQVWLDGSDPNNGTIPVNGSTIGTWVDKVTGNLHSATPVNTANKAVYKAAGTIGGIKNTLGTMYFNNTPYKIPYTSFSPTYTIFSVFRVERGLLTSGLSMTPVTTNSCCYILSGGQECCLYFGMMYDQFLTAVGVPPSTWYGMAVNTPATYIRSQWVIATMQYSAATKTTTTFLNGITMTAKGPDTTAQNSGNAWNDFYIGQSVTSADYRLQGYIGEILIYNSVLSTVDRKKVESYLSLKYGLGVAITRMYTFPTSVSFTSLQTSAFSTKLSFSPVDGFDSASVIIYYHATNSSTSPTQCGTGTISSSGYADITCTLPDTQVVYIYAKVTSSTGVEGVLLCSTLSGTVTSLPQPYVAFTTANGGVSVSTSSGNISAWNQTGSTIASTVTMKPAAVNSGIVAAGSNVTLVNNIFGTQPGISSNASGCMTTSAEILFGGAADSSLQFSIYILGRPNSNSAQAQYLGGGFSNTSGNSLNGHLSIFTRSTNGYIANNTQNTTEMWKPGGNGQQGPFSYPNTNGFEIWCLCKNAGYVGTEVYRNNATLASTGADYISQRNIAGPSPYELSAFWRIGGGASYYANGSSYIGAFYVYNTYHDSTTRGKIQAMLETSFGMTAS